MESNTPRHASISTLGNIFAWLQFKCITKEIVGILECELYEVTIQREKTVNFKFFAWSANIVINA